MLFTLLLLLTIAGTCGHALCAHLMPLSSQAQPGFADIAPCLARWLSQTLQFMWADVTDEICSPIISGTGTGAWHSFYIGSSNRSSNQKSWKETHCRCKDEVESQIVFTSGLCYTKMLLPNSDCFPSILSASFASSHSGRCRCTHISFAQN